MEHPASAGNQVRIPEVGWRQKLIVSCSSITQELAAMSLQKAQEKKAGKRREAAASPGNISPKKKSTPSFAPPSLDSAEFEELVLPGPPPPSGRHRQ